jgi:DNA-binding response OmpR family regulator
VQGAKILLLDDDRETRWAFATVLRREGAQVTEGPDGEEGLRQLLRSRFDLLVTDVCMPGLGGFGLYSTLRFGEGEELAWARTLPVILISGKVPCRELVHALDAGVDDVIEKPFDPEELKARVRSTLRRSRLLGTTRTRTRGDLTDFGMTALAQAVHLGGRSARLVVESPVASAVVDFQRGAISHATFLGAEGDFRGAEAAVHALALDAGVFEVAALPDPATRSIFEDTPSLLLRAAALHDETTGSIEEKLRRARAVEDEETAEQEAAEAAEAARADAEADAAEAEALEAEALAEEAAAADAADADAHASAADAEAAAAVVASEPFAAPTDTR